MTKGIKVLTTALIIIVGILALSTGFFYAENSTLKTKIKVSSTEQPAPTDTEDTILDEPLDSAATKTDEKTETPATTKTTTTTTPATTTTTKTTEASTSTKTTTASNETYTVKSGDTMSTIASGFGISWIDLAKANGLDETTADKIKIGQVLTVPKK